MTNWDGTAKSASEALHRFVAGQQSELDWMLMSEVVGVAMNVHLVTDENKRLQNRIYALEVEARALVERLKGQR